MTILVDTAAYLTNCTPNKLLEDIDWFRGDSFPIELAIKKCGEAVDLTGASLVLTVNKKRNPTNSPTTQLFYLEGNITDEVNGLVSFTPSQTNTDIYPATYYYDIQLTLSGGHVITISHREFRILQDITKATADGLYPSENLHPSDDLYPSGA